MSPVELYRVEKARHAAKLAPIYAEIRAVIDAMPLTPQQVRMIAMNKARQQHPDRPTANASYYARHRDAILAKQKARRRKQAPRMT